MKQHCRFCSLQLKASMLVVHDPQGVSGHFCDALCYEKARAGKVVASVERLHADLDTLMPAEGIIRG